MLAAAVADQQIQYQRAAQVAVDQVVEVRQPQELRGLPILVVAAGAAVIAAATARQAAPAS